MRRKRLVIAVGLLLVVCVAVASWLVGARVQSSKQAASRAASPTPSLVTATVEFRVLESTVIARGDVSAVVSTDVNGPRAADGAPEVVTAVFASDGSSVDDGDRLLEVSGRPVFVFEGSTPAYRTLRPGASGADVRQLQAGLVASGCEAGDSGTYDTATKTCVEKMYVDGGYDVQLTSTTETDDLAKAQSDLTGAQDGLASAQATLARASKAAPEADVERAQLELVDATRRRDESKARLAKASGSARASSQDDLDSAELAVNLAQIALDELSIAPDTSVEQLAVEQAEASVKTATQALSALQERSGPVVPLGEVVFAPTLPARFDSTGVAVGTDVRPVAGATSTSGLGVLTSGGWHVTALVPAAAHDLVAVGMPVDLVEETSGTSINGTVATIAERPSVAATAGAGLTYPVIIDGTIPDEWVGENLRVTFSKAATRDKVLVVPLSAVSSRPDGHPQVRVDRDGQVVPVLVQPSVSADGFVSVMPEQADALTAGDQVVVGP
ncbi:MAG: peptidoglycan-binding domain 1 protein [Ilumatobacteraceae bacterium]|nr:peptidoglycan-binding domain 1 protein [Ilumatobacteraceae bacterium]